MIYFFYLESALNIINIFSISYFNYMRFSLLVICVEYINLRLKLKKVYIYNPTTQHNPILKLVSVKLESFGLSGQQLEFFDWSKRYT